MASEFDLIGRYFTRAAPAGVLGVGDDCAMFPVPPGQHVVTSVDLLLEGRHFFSDVDPRALGHKSLAVNLSDLAAMGASPLGCVLGIGLPQADEAWVAAFSEGLLALCDTYACPLIGGDTTRSNQGVVISVTVFGAVDPSRALRRDAARVDDDIWVSGVLGAADVAYRLLDGALGSDPVRLAATRRALEWPTPRLALGSALAGLAHAALDVSDGLLQDLGHILKASAVGAVLDYAALPVDPALAGLPPEDLAHAVLAGGDVYELCFTAPRERRAAVQQAAHDAGVHVSRIGTIQSDPGLVILDEAGKPMSLRTHGFDHFGPT